MSISQAWLMACHLMDSHTVSSNRPHSGDQRMPTSDVTIGTGGRRGTQ